MLLRSLTLAAVAVLSILVVITGQLEEPLANAASLSVQRLSAPEPQCTDHDPTKWHGLVARNADGSVRCTYDHEHKSNPHALDDRLGLLPVAEISYPWQTHNHTTGTAENDAKHRVYGWLVARQQPCVSRYAPMSMTDIRMEVHDDGNGGATTRAHSYWAQARLCDPRDPTYHSTISVGGHMDFGPLFVRERASDGSLHDEHVPLPDDPTTSVPHNISRLHGSPSYAMSSATWYGANAIESSQTHGARIEVGSGWVKEDWGPVDPDNPSRVMFYGGLQNGSTDEPVHSLAITISSYFASVVGSSAGRVTFDGFTDVNGNLAPTCTAPGPNCVPLKLVNVKVGYYQFRFDDHEQTMSEPEFDVLDNTGHSLIRFPN